MTNSNFKTLAATIDRSLFNAVPCLLASLILLANLPYPCLGDDSLSSDRPGITNGSLVISPDTVQIEMGAQGDYQDSLGGDDQSYGMPTLIRIGLSKQVELRLESDLFSYDQNSDQDSISRTSGYSPINLGTKYEFLSGSENAPTMGAILQIAPPSGSSDFSTKHVNSDLLIAGDFAVGNLDVGVNVGGAIYEDDDHQLYFATLAGVTVSLGVADKLNVFVDTGIQQPESKRGTSAVVSDVGASYLLNSDTQIDCSIGAGVHGDDTPDFTWSSGFSRRFR